MKRDTEQDTKKKSALSEYLEMKSELNYWAGRVAEAEQLNTYRSPSASRVPSRSAPGDPTGTALTMLETAKENKKRAEEKKQRGYGQGVGNHPNGTQSNPPHFAYAPIY